MTRLRMTAHFEAPIDRVFELATDFRRYPEWSINYSEIKEVSGPTQHLGTRIHTVMHLLGRGLAGWAEIVDIETPRLLRLAGCWDEGGTNLTTVRLTATGLATEVEVELEYELPGGVFSQVADRLFVERAFERDLRHSLENFKSLIEVRQRVFA